MVLTKCSICQKSYDLDNISDRRAHDRECHVKSRVLSLTGLLRETNQKQAQIDALYQRKRKTLYENQHVVQPDVQHIQFSDMESYSAIGMCGIIPNELEEICVMGHDQGKNLSKNSNVTKRFKVRNGKSERIASDIVNNNDDENCGGIDRSDNISLRISSGEKSSNGEEISSITTDVPLPNPEHDALVTTRGPQTHSSSALVSLKSNMLCNSIGPIITSRKERAQLELASILTSINAPYHVYSSIIKWAQNLKETDLKNPCSFKKLVSDTSEKYGLRGTFPQTTTLLLPSRNSVPVTKFSFEQQLYSILSDDELMSPENLVYGENFFDRAKPHGPNHVYDDVHTGNWWLRTESEMCKKQSDVLVPLILFIDKSHVRSRALEPLCFTLGIFKRNIRNTPMAWRNLGLIPGKVGDLYPKIPFAKNKLAEMRLNDWHFIIAHLLDEFKTQQLYEGIDWEFKGKRCSLKIPLMFIIGDIEGHDKICSRKSGHTRQMNGVTHSCDVTRGQCSNVNHNCCFFNYNSIKHHQDICQSITSSVEEKKYSKAFLDKKGFYSGVKNAFFTLDYGSNQHGVHGQLQCA